MKHMAPAIAACLIATAALAVDDPTWRATRLDPLMLDAKNGFSIDRYEIETGTYYRWRIESDGLEEYKLLAPGLFRESWIDKIVVEDRTVTPAGLHAIEFDAAGEIDIWFVPIRPGRYDYYIEGLETQGFKGVFVVK